VKIQRVRPAPEEERAAEPQASIEKAANNAKVAAADS
jgi:hypothetical protein